MMWAVGLRFVGSQRVSADWQYSTPSHRGCGVWWHAGTGLCR